MARPREFDPDAALEGAMQVFWKKGYDNASLPDLLDGMGLTRGSFYKAFSSKDATFELALQRYDAQIVEGAVALLKDPNQPDGATRIRAVFDVVTDAVRDGDVRGCLLCTTAAGPSYANEEIEQTTSRLLDRMRDGFQTALQVAPGVHPSAVANLTEMLLSSYTGLRILARARVPAAVLEQSVAALMLSLGSRA